MQGQIASIRCNAFPKNRTDVLKSYIRDRWVYVAMRIDPGALTTDNEQKLRWGELQPVSRPALFGNGIAGSLATGYAGG